MISTLELKKFWNDETGGLQKSIRLMKIADKFNLTVVIFIDTPGAYPGVALKKEPSRSNCKIN